MRIAENDCMRCAIVECLISLSCLSFFCPDYIRQAFLLSAFVAAFQAHDIIKKCPTWTIFYTSSLMESRQNRLNSRDPGPSGGVAPMAPLPTTSLKGSSRHRITSDKCTYYLGAQWDQTPQLR